MKKNKICIWASLSLSLLLSTNPANAQNEPGKIVIGFAAGGALDRLSRIVADKLSAKLGKPFLVENKPGASTRIALDFVKRSKPDGNTILLTPATPFTLAPLTVKNLPYDPHKDLKPLAHLVDAPAAVVASTKQPFSNFKEYISWLKNNPDQSGFGVVSLGSGSHFGILMMNQELNVKSIPVSYKGGAPMLTDTIGGSLPVSIDAVASQLELYKTGKIKILGLSGAARSPILPDVPTLKEQGATGFGITGNWYGAFAPAGTPPAIMKKIESALLSIVNDPDVKKELLEIGLVANGKDGESLRKLIIEQSDIWKPIVEKSGFTLN